MDKNDFPDELKTSMTDLGFDFETLFLIDEEKKNGIFYFLDEFDIWFPANREYRDFILITIEVHRDRRDKSFAIVFVHGHATRYFRKKNLTQYHSEVSLIYQQDENLNRQIVVEQLRNKMFVRHIRTETQKLNQLISSSKKLYANNLIENRHSK